MSKTEQTLEVIKKKCEQFYTGEWVIKLYLYRGEIIGFDQEGQPLIKFRATEKVDKHH
jgi:hypothetical protein